MGFWGQYYLFRSKSESYYAAPGSYTVVLKVTNGGCEHFIKKNVVVISENGRLEAGATESCTNTNILFKVKI